MSAFGGRVNDAFQAAKNLKSQQEEKTSLVDTVSAIEHVLEDLREKRTPDKMLLDSLELGSSRGYALRMKLRGLLQVKKSRLQKINSSMLQDIDILQKISVCPYCGGNGEKLGHGYERFGRRIHTTISADNCEHCEGSGKAELGTEVEKIVEEALKLVSKSSDEFR